MDGEFASTGYTVANLKTSREPTPKWLATSLLLLSTSVLLAVAFVAVVHIDDRYRIDVASGARISLARSLDQGVLYPELHDGDFYGGTRFMPLPVLMHGGLSAFTGEYLVSGKIISYVTMASLLLVVFVVLRRMRCPPSIALGLTVAVLLTETGLAATTSLRGDTLPLLLQVCAVAIVAESRRPKIMIAASGLAALALAAKLSAVWAPIAIFIWLFVKDRKRLAWFVAGFVCLTTVMLTVLTAITEGRFLENVFGLSTAGVGGLHSLLVAPYRLVLLTVDQALGAAFLLPLVAGIIWVQWRQRELSIYVLSLLCSIATITLVLTDIGTGWNQLVDLPVLIALVLGEFVGRESQDPRAATTFTSILGMFLMWVILVGIAITLVPAVGGAVRSLRDSRLYSSDPLAGSATSSTKLLSEDPYVPVSLGQTPVVLDPFMLLRIGRDDPNARKDLVNRISAREFELIVLVNKLEPFDQQWWRDYHFGTDVTRAIARSYRFRGKLQGYYLYEPAQPAGDQTL
jgi:hypothetical protein